MRPPSRVVADRKGIGPQIPLRRAVGGETGALGEEPSLFAGPRDAETGRDHTTSAAFGLQLGSYRQLRDAVAFLRENGLRVETDLPSELHPGIDYAAHAFDPEGHCIQLYYYMEQVGWDGKVRPKAQRRVPSRGEWPAALEPLSDTYHGEPFLGPWG